jgi:hypothetical protein
MVINTPRVQLFTAEDLLQMPDDGFRYELVKGELRKIGPSQVVRLSESDILDGNEVVPGWMMPVRDLF